MFWADRIAGEIQEHFKDRIARGESLVVRDEKTVSGRVHVGSMRGVVIHGTVSEALSEIGVANTFTYEFNDVDPMDDVPGYLPSEIFEKYLGMPLNQIPSPEEYVTQNGQVITATTYAEYFAVDFKNIILNSGFNPKFQYSSELYNDGRMDSVIREALEGADTISRIYKEVSGSERPPGWLPISVLCPTCAKLLTTEASDFDGATVAVMCLKQKGAFMGCGFTGRVSPFGGASKLAWKVDWAAKWKILKVDVEGAGKDHSTKGGSRDVANRISREVFHYEPPFDIPYEFFLVGGQKMSSSKGRGASAAEIADLTSPKIFRLAMLSKDINQAVNFDPSGETVPTLYDLFDKLEEHYKSGVEDDYRRLFHFIYPLKYRGDIKTPFELRFSQVVFLVQMPHLNIQTEAAEVKGVALTEDDTDALHERSAYAQVWIRHTAPEKYVFALQDHLPEVAKDLSEVQKQALGLLRDYIDQHASKPTGEEMHHKLHALKDEVPISPSELFSAIYLCFLGKSYGPKAGWFLSVLDREFVVERFTEAIS